MILAQISNKKSINIKSLISLSKYSISKNINLLNKLKSMCCVSVCGLKKLNIGSFSGFQGKTTMTTGCGNM